MFATDRTISNDILSIAYATNAWLSRNSNHCIGIRTIGNSTSHRMYTNQGETGFRHIIIEFEFWHRRSIEKHLRSVSFFRLGNVLIFNVNVLFHCSIKCDLVVISCDTVTNINLFKMLNLFRQNDASIVTQLFKGGLEADAIVPGPKTKHKQGK